MRNSVCSLTALVLVAAAAVQGADFLTSGGSARSVGVAGIYIPASDNVLDAMAINPAGLALLGSPRLDVTLEAGHARGTFTNSVSSEGTLNSTGVVPFGAFGMPLSGRARRFTIGVAAVPEILSAARWHYSDPPGGVGKVSYGNLRSNSAITAIRSSLGVAVSLSSRIQLGLTIGSVYNANTLQTAYVFQNYQPLAGLKTLLDLRTSGVGWNSGAGVLIRATRRVEFGAAYRAGTTVRSVGSATGNAGIQFAAIGLGAARPDFRYDAEVDNRLPQSSVLSASWQATRRTKLALQGDWVGWSGAFRTLPVLLTKGNNSDINGLLGTSSITDSIPLDWRDQWIARIGVERRWRENGVLRAGYTHSNSPVPGSTLSPLTAAITRQTISAGAGYSGQRWRIDAAWTLDPQATQRSGQSALKSGEFSNTVVRVGTQAIVLSTSLRL